MPKNIHRWVKRTRHSANFPYSVLGSKDFVRLVPLGLVGNIWPWNFPISLALSPVGGGFWPPDAV
ncbi:aldehyde dehydrogenase family protein [Halioxenophilus aromaticivorans]|uniref:aldehyde dehydrogenase family protein n=1 Tax=Halioxenophilus aromaticivorans TaxID=1306992 RepID=UPI0036F1B229